MDFQNNPPSISGDAHTYLSEELSADAQLSRGLLTDPNHHHQSEAFKLGLLAGLAEARRVVNHMFYRPDLED